MTTPASTRPIPVILDTDIGGDIDDTWALAMMLLSPELDVKLIVSDTGDTPYRAKIIARMLESVHRTDIPIGIGLMLGKRYEPTIWRDIDRPLVDWVKEVNLQRYPALEYDGVDAMIRTILNSPEIVTLIAIGPLTNIAEALEREPAIAPRCRLVGMDGAIYDGYGQNKAEAEYNVAVNPAASQKVFSAPWKEITITPLDSCKQVVLSGDNYSAIKHSTQPLPRAIMEQYRLWRPLRLAHGPEQTRHEACSTSLFDTVAVHLAYSTRWLKMERLNVRVTDDGRTVIDPSGAPMNVATGWTDRPSFERFLTERLLN